MSTTHATYITLQIGTQELMKAASINKYYFKYGMDHSIQIKGDLENWLWVPTHKKPTLFPQGRIFISSF